MIKKRVTSFFGALLVFGIFLFALQVSYFGPGVGITGFAVSRGSLLEVSLSMGNFDNVDFKSGKLVLIEGSGEGEYTSDIIDFGSSVEIEKINWKGNVGKQKIIYDLRDLEGSSEVVASFDNGKSWENVEDEIIREKVLNAKVKGDLIDESSSDFKFQIKACDSQTCKEGEFKEVDMSNVGINTRYLQYKIILRGGSEVYVDSVSIKYSELKSDEGKVQGDGLGDGVDKPVEDNEYDKEIDKDAPLVFGGDDEEI